jgi:antitoxin MazE
MLKTQVVKWGNSLAVRIPRPVAEKAGVAEGDPLILEAERGEIKLVRSERIPTLKELVSQITPQNRYEEISMGAERGKEIVEW